MGGGLSRTVDCRGFEAAKSSVKLLGTQEDDNGDWRDEGAGMDLMLAGKIAVVTGASKGIGMAVTKALVQEGACVVAGALTIDSLVDLDGVTAVALDLSDPAAPAALVQRAVDEHGTIDVLVNNVGAVKLRLDGFLAVSDEDFEWSLQMNFFTTVRATRAAVAMM